MNISACTLISLIAAVSICQAGVRDKFPEFFKELPAREGAKNGWDLMLQLREFPKSSEPFFRKKDFNSESWLKALDFETAEKLVHEHRDILAAFEEILLCPVIRPGAEPLDAMSSGSLVRLARTFKLYMASAAIQARGGDVTGALEKCGKCADFSRRYLEAQPILIDSMVAAVLMKLSVKAAAYIACSSKCSLANLQYVAAICEKQDDIGPLIQKTLLGEARWGFQHFEPMLKPGEGRRSLLIELAAGKEIIRQMASGTTTLDTEESLRKRWAGEMPKELKDALKAADEFDWALYFEDWALNYRAILKADMNSVTAFWKTYQKIEPRVPLEGTPLEPYFTSEMEVSATLIQLSAETVASIRLASTASILRAYELENGSLPGSLEDIVPRRLDAVPPDPFSGDSMRYNRSRRTLWFVGMNLKDEGGECQSDDPEGKDDQAFILPPVP